MASNSLCNGIIKQGLPSAVKHELERQFLHGIPAAVEHNVRRDLYVEKSLCRHRRHSQLRRRQDARNESRKSPKEPRHPMSASDSAKCR